MLANLIIAGPVHEVDRRLSLAVGDTKDGVRMTPAEDGRPVNVSVVHSSHAWK